MSKQAIRPEGADGISTSSNLTAIAPDVNTSSTGCLRLSHAEYREFAELCKAEAGKPLNLTSTKDMGGDLACVNFWALPMFDDVTDADQKYRERSYIYLAPEVKPDAVRAAGVRRPECDWSKLRDSEIYPFIVWHEIGHVRDNFHPMDQYRFIGAEPEVRAVLKSVKYINEVLADRFAWERVRPGEPMPLTEYGRRNADQIERDIEAISQYMVRAKYAVKPLPAGQYRSVPAYMLSSKRKAAYVGPDVSPRLIARESKYHREYKAARGSYMSGVAL